MLINEHDSQESLLQTEMINFTPSTAAKCSDLALGRTDQKIVGGPNKTFAKFGKFPQNFCICNMPYTVTK